jgi:hypothetical protein
MASLRLTVTDDTMAELQRIAKATGTSVAKSANLVLAFGLAAVDAITDPAAADRAA